MSRETYISGDWTVAEKFGDQRPFYPIPHLEETVYAFAQDYTQARDQRVNLPLNTPSTDDSNALLQLESAGNDLGNLMTRWTRSYFRVPATWSDWEQGIYTFPGFPGYLAAPNSGAAPIGRNPYVPPGGVRIRVQYDYFVIGAPMPGVLNSAGDAITVVATENAIPIIPRQTYYVAGNPTVYFEPPSVTPAGGVTVGDYFYQESVPTRATYNALVAAGTEIVIADSAIQRYVGNIWARITRYTIAR